MSHLTKNLSAQSAHNLYAVLPEVYLCPLDKQNDPFEFAFNSGFSEIVKQVPQLKQGTNITDLNKAFVFQNLWNKISEEIQPYKSKMSIACFCEEKDNILLWTHYANNSKGMCIEYSAWDLLERFQCFLLPVIYQKELPTLPSIEEINTLSSCKIACERIATKSEMWSYENEWRIVKCIEPNNNHCIDFPKPTAIYLGINASAALENKVLKICVAQKIPLYKMKADRYSYLLNEEAIYTAPKGAQNNGQTKNGNP